MATVGSSIWEDITRMSSRNLRADSGEIFCDFSFDEALLFFTQLGLYIFDVDQILGALYIHVYTIATPKELLSQNENFVISGLASLLNQQLFISCVPIVFPLECQVTIFQQHDLGCCVNL